MFEGYVTINDECECFDTITYDYIEMCEVCKAELNK